MKTKIGIAIWAIITLLTLYVSVRTIDDLWSANTLNIGPHEIRSVTDLDTVTISVPNITITSQEYFEIQDPVSKKIIFPEVIPPSVGETETNFVIKSPPLGKYVLLRASANFYSETPTKITVRKDAVDAFFASLLIVLGTILTWALAFVFVGPLFLDD